MPLCLWTAIHPEASPFTMASPLCVMFLTAEWLLDGGRRPRPSESPRRLGDGLDDEMVAGAAAEVARQHFPDLTLRRRRMFLQERARAHDDPRGAVAALEPVLGPECLLDGVKRLAERRDALDGRHLVSVGLRCQHEAGADGLAVEEHRAGTADAVFAPDVGARKIEVFTEEIGQGRAH